MLPPILLDRADVVLEQRMFTDGPGGGEDVGDGQPYPAMIETQDGKLVITYTWRRTHIKFVTADPAKCQG